MGLRFEFFCPPKHKHHHHRGCGCHECKPPQHDCCPPKDCKPKSCCDD
jgi:hypothetical protein